MPLHPPPPAPLHPPSLRGGAAPPWPPALVPTPLPPAPPSRGLRQSGGSHTAPAPLPPRRAPALASPPAPLYSLPAAAHGAPLPPDPATPAPVLPLVSQPPSEWGPGPWVDSVDQAGSQRLAPGAAVCAAQPSTACGSMPRRRSRRPPRPHSSRLRHSSRHCHLPLHSFRHSFLQLSVPLHALWQYPCGPLVRRLLKDPGDRRGRLGLCWERRPRAAARRAPAPPACGCACSACPLAPGAVQSLAAQEIRSCKAGWWPRRRR